MTREESMSEGRMPSPELLFCPAREYWDGRFLGLHLLLLSDPDPARAAGASI